MNEKTTVNIDKLLKKFVSIDNLRPKYMKPWRERDKVNFRVERRLGCIGCPLRSDKGKADFVKYPKFLKRLIASTQEWLDTHPNVKIHGKYSNAYNQMFHNLFTNSYDQYHNLVTGGMFPETAIDTKKFLEDYFKIDLTI